MNIYILGYANPKSTADFDEILGVFSTAKKARKEFDRVHGMNTKNKWKKISEDVRCFDGCYYIGEWTLDTEMAGSE